MKHVSLKKRLLLGSILICTLITLCVSLYQISRLQEREEALLQREIAGFEQSTMASLREAVWNYDWSMVKTVISSQINPLLTYIEICDSEREQCVEAGTRGQTPLREHSLLIDYRNSFQGPSIEVGTAYLQFRCQPFGELFNRYILTEFLTSGLDVFGVAVAIFMLFYLGAIRRIVSVANYTRQIDLTGVESLSPLVLEKHGSAIDEVDLLADSINGLIERMKEEFSRRKQLESQLNHTQKMEALGTLAGGVAHDFNNILTAMLGYVQLCYNSAEMGSKTQNRLEQVLMAGDRAAALIAQIMAFSRKSENHTKKICLAEVVTEALDLAQASWPETIELEVNLDDSLWITGDAGQLHQVLLNLATNSGYALAETGGKITVSLATRTITVQDAELLDLGPGTYVCLTFRDNGPGIPENIQSRVFDPFFTTKETGKGTGMGLAVVHGIVQAHDGDIILEAAEAHGCCFTLYFPQVEAEKKELGNLPYDIGSAIGSSEHVLLVDDDPVVIGMGQDMLRSLGYQVTICSQPSQVLELLHDHNDIDLLITDLTMPEMTGVELAVQLRQENIEIPIVLYTENVDLFDPAVLADGTINLLLKKPFTVKDLSLVVRRALGG